MTEIKTPVRYDEEMFVVYDADNRMLCDLYGKLIGDDKAKGRNIGNEIAEALNAHADLKAKCEAMAELCEAAKEVIEMQRAYDTKFFPEVPKEKWTDVTIAVANVGVPLDCISASNMRHTAKRAADILGEPLAQAFAAMESEQPTGERYLTSG